MAPPHRALLQRDLVLCPVTALAFYLSNNQRLYLLAGEDSHIHIYDVETGKLCGRFRVFAGRVIHGIFVVPEPTPKALEHVLVWGAQSVAVFPRLHVELLLAGQTPPPPVEVEAPDWIYDGVLSPYHDNRGAIVTAHNEVVPLSFGPGGRNITLGAVMSPSRPILYSACTVWTAENRLLVAGGTVFGEVVVWECKLVHELLGQGTCHSLDVFHGHEGSIFGVAFSQPVTLPSGARGRLLASCSDDRTIRVWGVVEPRVDAAPQPQQRSKDFEARETGFKNSSALIPGGDEASTSSMELAAAMGHISRIWHVKFGQQDVNSTNTNPLSLWSFGEDTSACEWRLSLNLWQRGDHVQVAQDAVPIPSPMGPLGELTLTRTIPCHSGKHIWAAAAFSHSKHPPLIATGGADGKIDLIGDYTGTAAFSPNQEKLLALIVPEAMLSVEDTGHLDAADEPPIATTGKRGGKMRQDGFNILAFALISKNRLITVTAKGKLLLADIGADIIWIEAAISDSVRSDLKWPTVVKGFKEGIAFIGTTSGRVYVYLDAERRLVQLAELQAKIEDIFALSEPKETSVPSRVLVTMRSRNYPVVLDVKPPALESGPSRWKELPLDKNVVVTSASACQGIIIVGSRNGALFLFRESTQGVFVQEHCQERAARDSIVAIVWLPPLDKWPSSSFLTVSRLGAVRILKIEFDELNDISLLLRNESSIALTNPDAWFAKSETGPLDLVFCGFRGSKFMVWNETRQKQISVVECGGHDRMYTYVSDADNANWLRFVFARGPTINIYSQVSTTHSTLKAGTHGREIRAVSSNSHFFATGSEDTNIRVWKLYDQATDAEPRWRCLTVLTRHRTGMQCLKWLGDDYLLSSAGSEELFIWRVSALDDTLYDGLAVICESAFPFQTPDGDLRITCFDVEPAATGEGIYISLVLSNSSLQTYHYSLAGGWQPLSKGSYTGACPTHIQHLRLQPGEALEVLTAFTDGSITLWRATRRDGERLVFSEYEMMHTVQAHQSAIKSLAIATPCTDAGRSLLVMSGGDDNAMAINILKKPNEKPSFAFGQSYRVSKAHAAAITGVCILRADKREVVVATCSNDQRVKMWKVRLGDTQAEDNWEVEGVQLLSNEYSSVADPADLELMPSRKELMVVGVGMETWTLTDEGSSHLAETRDEQKIP